MMRPNKNAPKMASTPNRANVHEQRKRRIIVNANRLPLRRGDASAFSAMITSSAKIGLIRKNNPSPTPITQRKT